MHYLQIAIPTPDPSLQEILIARLSALGYEGFEEHDDYLDAYIPETNFDAQALQDILLGHQLTCHTERLEQRNWNEEWEKNFQPVVVDDFCAIRAGFHAPIARVEHELVITPKMSFGTGHHATTYMMIDAMRRLDFTGKSVFDFGTGTGVLAILAERLGARQVLAIDHDDWSIDNAGENSRENHCNAITLIKSDTVPSQPNGFDIILANINKHVILQHLPLIGQQLRKGGVILLSGLLVEDEPEIRAAAVKNNLPISVRMTKGNWICLECRKEE